MGQYPETICPEYFPEFPKNQSIKVGCERLRLLGTPLGCVFEAIILELSARRSPPARHIECLLWVNAQWIKIVWCYLAGQTWRRCKPSGKRSSDEFPVTASAP